MLAARIPTIRASDYEGCLADPYRYLLTRRYGLADPLYWSPALAHGGWFHAYFEHLTHDSRDRDATLSQRLASRLAELELAARAAGLLPAAITELLEAERQTFLEAGAWFDAISTLPLPGPGAPLPAWMRQPHLRILGFELRAVLPVDSLLRLPSAPFDSLLARDLYAGGPPIELYPPLAAQYDALLYHTDQNSLWIVDPKTCSEPPTVRLRRCPLEFQTEHYLAVLAGLVALGVPQKTYHLPSDVRVGGMIHVAVQKPGLKLCDADRDFSEYAHVLKSGPRKGQTEMRREYRGEPRYSNYVARILRWYHATDEYSHLAAERVSEPPVNRSLLTGGDPSSYWTPRYLSRLAFLSRHATMDPSPDHFLSSAMGTMDWSRESKFAPFYHAPPSRWADLAAEACLTQHWRDEDLLTLLSTGDSIAPSIGPQP
jgi:hypothetical protein